MSIKNKLYLTLIVPVAALLIFSVSGIIRNYGVYHGMHVTSDYVESSALVSKVVHETQKERGMTAGFLGSKGSEFASELPAQRNKTDEALKAFKTFYKNNPDEFVGEIKNQIDKTLLKTEDLSGIRRQVDSFSIKLGDAIGFYSKLNNDFLESIAAAAAFSNDALISRNLIGYMNFLLAKERMGIERAVLTNVFVADSFGPGLYDKFSKLVSEQETYLKVFELSASADFFQFYNNAAGDSAVSKVKQMRETAVAKASEGGFGIDPKQWFATMTQMINAMKKADDKMSDDIMALAISTLSSAKSSMTFNVVGSLFSLASLLVLLYVIRFSVIGSLSKLIKLTHNLNSGDANLTQRINVESKDEMHELAENINTFIASIEEIVIDVKNISNNLASSSAEFAATAEQLSSTFSEQTGQVNDMASAMEEMNVTSKSINDNTGEANSLTIQAFELTQEGSGELFNAVSKINSIKVTTEQLSVIIEKLNNSSNEIGAIVGAIADIADQTNLLALNAAIEAARAGDAGRGFAVVADEVRKLAEKTQDSTKTITSIITTLVNESNQAGASMGKARTSVEEGVEVIELTTEIFNKIQEAVSKVREANDFVSVSISEQADAIDASSANIRHVYEGISESTSAVEQISFTVNDLEKQAVTLNDMMQRFKTK